MEPDVTTLHVKPGEKVPEWFPEPEKETEVIALSFPHETFLTHPSQCRGILRDKQNLYISDTFKLNARFGKDVFGIKGGALFVWE